MSARYYLGSEVAVAITTETDPTTDKGSLYYYDVSQKIIRPLGLRLVKTSETAGDGFIITSNGGINALIGLYSIRETINDEANECLGSSPKGTLNQSPLNPTTFNKSTGRIDDNDLTALETTWLDYFEAEETILNLDGIFDEEEDIIVIPPMPFQRYPTPINDYPTQYSFVQGAMAEYFKDVETLEITPSVEFDEKDFIGYKTRAFIPLRSNITITITQVKKDDFWSQIWNKDYRQGSYFDSGVANLKASFFKSTESISLGKGFRIFVRERYNIASDKEWFTIKGCILTDYKVDLSPNRAVMETLTFTTKITPSNKRFPDLTPLSLSDY